MTASILMLSIGVLLNSVTLLLICAARINDRDAYKELWRAAYNTGWNDCLVGSDEPEPDLSRIEDREDA